MGYPSLGAAIRGAEAAENEMRVQVAEFAEDVQRHAQPSDVRVRRPRGGRGGAVGEDGDVQAGEEPIVEAVLDEVEQRHRGGGEAVDEEGFQLAFQEVQGYEGAGEGLEEGWRGWTREKEVEERVDEEGTEVFEDVNEAPGYLRACRRC